MKYIDAFNHFFPRRLWERMGDLRGGGMVKRMRGVPCAYDLDARLRLLDGFADRGYSQVLSLGMPPIEAMAGPEQSPELARLGNDGLAELVAKYPDRFPGYVASLPMNAPDAAAREAERAFSEGANALQIHSNINGLPLDDPQFQPVFEVAARFDKPILLHPVRGAGMSDYASEDKSQYEIWFTFGWPYETSAAMARLVFSGMMDRLPTLKIVAHHMGAMVPFFEGRVGQCWDELGARTSDVDLQPVRDRMTRRPYDYFKDFYADTAIFGSRAATVCGLSFFGADKVLFASDCPFDPEGGARNIREAIAVLESIEMPDAEREQIAFRNAEKLFALN